MKKEKNNFARVVEWLLDNEKAKDQKELAAMIGTTQTTITRNKNGEVKCTSNKVIRQLCDVFGDDINIAYLRGESDIMLVADLHQSKTTDISSHKPNNTNDNQTTTTTIGMDAMTSALISSKDETITALRSQLADKDEIIASLRSQLADKGSMLADKESLVNDKDVLITSLQQQVIDLREKLTIEI